MNMGKLLKRLVIFIWNKIKQIKMEFYTPKILNKIFAKFKNFWIFLEKLSNKMGVISTLAIFFGLIIYIYGHIVTNNQSDNDLIMNQINEAVSGEEILAINATDIHGFGNNSIIVTTSNADMVSYGEEYSNNLVILDITENEVLRKMEDLLGLKSSYKTTFSYTILSDDIRFYPFTEYVLDVIGDSTKEIIVKYYVFGSTYGANGTAIYKYSYSDSQYKLIGTYPESRKVDLYVYDDEGNYIMRKAQQIETDFKNDLTNENSMIKCYDKKGNKFNLNHGKWNVQEYWAKSSIDRCVLVTVNIDDCENNPTYINIYQPIYNSQENLSWNLIYSEDVQGFDSYYTEDDLVRVLMDIMQCQVTLVEKQ